ncbi:unnamed protein product [Somion occarium]|uniref:Phospholipase C n=1 Tax=Somion occarium TaxID=3059160 RepID=A0ABP1CG23_9APHY
MCTSSASESTHDKSKDTVVFFESGEHEAIGNKVTLYYDSGNIPGVEFNFAIGSQSLSYGLVVALAGDFYANWKLGTGDVEQISDSWDTNPEHSIDLAMKIVNTLLNDDGGYLACILKAMADQEKEVLDGLASGQDPAQVYKSVADKYDTKYAKCTNLGYVWIALMNWDHFGVDAIKAYCAVHTAALRQAKKAHDAQSNDAYGELKKAYFLEAFAQHFLTDLFSTGHLRAPRRILHWTYFGNGPADPKQPNVDVYPADRCAQKMHDEDCSNGLWVSNQEGDSWAAYGDKQLWSGKSARNFLQALKAAQSGLLEVWNTKQTGTIPKVADYKALKLVPILSDLFGPSNFVPLFQWDASNPSILQFRSSVDDRQDAAKTSSISSKPSFLEWQRLLNQITSSVENNNMYPYTMSFLSHTTVWHLREADDENMYVNRYGAVDASDYGLYWNMGSQSQVSVPHIVGSMVWVTATYVQNDIYSLVGRHTPPNSSTISARHVGLRISKDDQTETVTVEDVWTSIVDDGNSYWTEGDTVYGNFSSNTADTGMLKYWTNGPRGASKIELWVIKSDMNTPPAKKNLKWEISPLNFMLSYQIETNDPCLTFIGYGFDQKAKNTKWYFSSWSQNYATQKQNMVEENINFPAQVLLSGKFGTDDGGSRIIRVFYGSEFGYSSPEYMRIDMINPTRDFSTGNINPQIVHSQSFLITWSAFFAKDYLTWFLADVNVNDYLDLVALARKPDGTLIVVVFPGQSDFTFGDPIISPITLDPGRGSLFDAPFMTHVKAGRAQSTYPAINGPATTTYAAILAFFDNVGILGSRIIAPVKVTGTYSYELKGQTPAIAGQVSRGLGLHDDKWMGRGELPQTVGIMW